MSDIWHTTNQNEKPTDVPEKGNFIILDGVLCNSGTWYDGEEPNIFWENVKRWCYLDELILENERTRKALDLALDALTTIGGYSDYNDCVGVALDAKDEIYKVLEQKE